MGGAPINYDAIGNPVEIGGYDLTWQGRELVRFTDNDELDIRFEYNADGIRTLKNVGGTKHKYTLNGSQIITESWGNVTVVYLYDESGSPIGMQYRVSSYAENVFKSYFFEKNLQGDIVAIYNESGTKIGTYTYDAWGNHTATPVSTATALERLVVTKYNPFRYRGYYYDTATGFYYLQSRYYNPEWGRFINADKYVSTGQGLIGYNMFAYCGNNPVSRIDPTGDIWWAVIAVVAVCMMTLTGCSSQPKPPEDYIQENSKNHNCYSYAFDLPHKADPGYFSVSLDDLSQMGDKQVWTSDEIANFVLRDMNALGKSVRIVDSPSEKLENEYIVAMKTSSTILKHLNCADYHFAVLLSDGTWADKTGKLPSRWNKIDGSAMTWDYGNQIEDYYDSKTVYFAVKRTR